MSFDKSDDAEYLTRKVLRREKSAYTSQEQLAKKAGKIENLKSACVCNSYRLRSCVGVFMSHTDRNCRAIAPNEKEVILIFKIRKVFNI